MSKELKATIDIDNSLQEIVGLVRMLNAYGRQFTFMVSGYNRLTVYENKYARSTYRKWINLSLPNTLELLGELQQELQDILNDEDQAYKSTHQPLIEVN